MTKFILVLLFTIPQVLYAAMLYKDYDFETDGIFYKITSEKEKTVEVVRSNYDIEHIKIPPIIRGYQVTSIKHYSFNAHIGLISVEIPNSVKSIGFCAFEGCSNLSLITIPNSVVEIDSEAFSETNWYKNKPDGVIYINNVLYKYKGTMPEGTSINVPNNILSISPGAFRDCTGLVSITIANSVRNIGDGAFRGCSGLTSVTIPNSVRSLEMSTFRDCKNLVSVNIPNSVTSIDWGVFAGCSSLESITIPNSVTSIDGGSDIFGKTFEDTKWYSNLPNGLIYINNVLYGYKGTMPEKTSVKIRKGTVSISSEAFKDCSGLTSIVIPKSVTSIGNYAFSGCAKLKSIKIPNGITKIEYDTFSGCSELKAIEIPEGVTLIERSAFSGCAKLKSIKIPNGITKIEHETFRGCSELKSIEIPEGVTLIGSSAFSGCTKLKTIEIPQSMTSIYQDAFAHCISLSAVYISDLTAWCNISFCPGDLISPYGNPLYYAGHLYLNGNEVTDLVIPDSVTNIHSYAFINCNGLKSLTIPNSVCYIGEGAFSGCDSLKVINFGVEKNIKDMGYNLFSDCKSIEKVYAYPSSLYMLFSKRDLLFDQAPFTKATLYIPEGYKNDIGYEFMRLFKDVKHIPEKLFKDIINNKVKY